MLQPTGQRPQTVGTFWISHGRASKRYCVEVSAPTGQSSITLPENGALVGLVLEGRDASSSRRGSSATSWPSSATSSEKRVQR